MIQTKRFGLLRHLIWTSTHKTPMWSVAGSIVAEQPHTNCSVKGSNSALNRDVPLQPNLWKLILKFRSLESAAMQEWQRQVSICYFGFAKDCNFAPLSLVLGIWPTLYYKAGLQVSWCQREEGQDSACDHQHQPWPNWVKARKCCDLLWVFPNAWHSPWSINLFGSCVWGSLCEQEHTLRDDIHKKKLF